MEAAVATIAILILFALLVDTRSRLSRAEATLREAAKRIGALQRAAESGGMAASRSSDPPPSSRAAVEPVDGGDRPEPRPVTAPMSVESAEEGLHSAAIPGAEPQPADPTTAKEPALAAIARSGAEPARARSTDAGMRFENLFGRTLPIWAGGITLAIAGVLIVRYAIDAGFFARVFTPGVQVVAGLLFGFGLIAGAEIAWRNEARLRDPRVPQALAGAGLATLYAAVLVAANVYMLIGPASAFLAFAGITAAALGLSLRFGAPSAVLGLAGGLAAPAMVGAGEPDVPLLAVYLGLTIAGLAGVARMRRWPWLAIAALVGGAGWSLWLMLASDALTAAASLSIGGLLLLLAIALPALSLAQDGQRFARTACAIVGAGQLALLVAMGGFALLNWGLFILIAGAAAWLAWRDDRFAIAARASLALSLLLLAIWPDPAPTRFAVIAFTLAAIHAAPLLMRLWRTPGIERAQDIVAVAVAAPLLTGWQFPELGEWPVAMAAIGGAALTGVGAALGWRAERRVDDARFAWLTTAVAGLAALAIAVLVPTWAIALPIAAAAGALLLFAPRTGDARIERSGTMFAVIATTALLITQADLVSDTAWLGTSETDRLWTGWTGSNTIVAFLRWSTLAVMAALFAARAAHPAIVRAGQLAAAILAYGALAQLVPGRWLMLVPALAGAAALVAMRRAGSQRLALAALAFAGIAFLWAAQPLAVWSSAAGFSLVAVPMLFDDPAIGAEAALLRLFLPAALLGSALLVGGRALPDNARTLALVVAGTVAGVALHTLYRLGFASLFGTDFVATGLAQRLLWSALLVGAGWLALRRGQEVVAGALLAAGAAHLLWYSLFLHNPLWSAQAVGAVPVINWLVPLFGLPWLAARVAAPLLDRWPALRHPLQPLWMLLVAGFAWANLRQLFHGSLLAQPGVEPAENILRSLLILLLAIGYLLWGIRTRRRDWRIASLVLMLGAVAKTFLFDASGLEGLARIGSFVALGFSLIGIGWLYSRQLARGPDSRMEPQP